MDDLSTEDKCSTACRLLPSSLRECVNESMTDSCGEFQSLPVQDGLLTTICVLCLVFILASCASHLVVLRRRSKDAKEEKLRLRAFTSTAQFYKYEPHKIQLPDPNMVAKQLYPDANAFDADDLGEPAAASGASLYGKWVTRGHEPPEPAALAMGGGRLQRLWLARGGAGGGKMTGSAERRLRRLATMRNDEAAQSAPTLTETRT